MGDLQGHPFHGNQYTATQVAAMDRMQDRALTELGSSAPDLESLAKENKIPAAVGDLVRIETDVFGKPVKVYRGERLGEYSGRRIGDSAAPAPAAPPSSSHEFTKDMTPRARVRAEDTLSNSITSGGMPYTRRELVEKMIKDGAKVVVSRSGERRLMKPDGAYLAESQISKTAMDYAMSLEGAE